MVSTVKADMAVEQEDGFTAGAKAAAEPARRETMAIFIMIVEFRGICVEDVDSQLCRNGFCVPMTF